MRSTLKVTSKGQVTLSKALRDELRVRPGDRIVVETLAPGRLEMRAEKSGGGLESFIGYFDNPENIHLTIEEMNEVIADSWAGGRGPWPPKE